jgi:hypothetical protein
MTMTDTKIPLCSKPHVAHLVDQKQKSGRLVPIFDSLLDSKNRAKQEAYILRQLERDKKFGY